MSNPVDSPLPAPAEGGRHFALGDILSVSDGRLVSRSHINGVYAIMNFMTGDNLSTIGLLAAMPPCKAALLAQHPQLAVVSEDRTELTPDTFIPWLERWEAKFGATLPVSPLASWEKRSVVDDILDINRMNPNAELMVIEDV